MKELDLTQGSVPKVLLHFAVPFLLANVLQALYGGADLFVVGQYDDAASVAAVAIGSQVMQTVTGVILGLTTGTTVLIAIATGAKDYRKTASIIGTSIGLFVMSMTGYVLQRKDFFYRNRISFIIYFTTIFGGGMVPWYILLSKYLHLQNSYVARVLPLLMTPFLIILMRTFISSSCPVEIVESAKIDGAGDFKIFNSIVLPIIGPGLATVGLFLALAYWNEWYLTSLFITNRDMYSLQFYLYDMLNSARFAQEMGMYVGDRELPSESIKMAMVVVTTGPIIFLYPFVQKYFVAGIAIGSVKG